MEKVCQFLTYILKFEQPTDYLELKASLDQFDSDIFSSYFTKIPGRWSSN